MVRGTEFGGQPGRIQPPPHELTAAERARLERAIDPVSQTGTVESQRAAEGNVINNPDYKGPATNVKPGRAPDWAPEE